MMSERAGAVLFWAGIIGLLISGTCYAVNGSRTERLLIEIRDELRRR